MRLFLMSLLLVLPFVAQAEEWKGTSRYIESDDVGAAVEVRGKAAKALYDSLKIEARDGIKLGTHVMCTETVCQMLFTDFKGTVRVLNSK